MKIKPPFIGSVKKITPCIAQKPQNKGSQNRRPDLLFWPCCVFPPIRMQHSVPRRLCSSKEHWARFGDSPFRGKIHGETLSQHDSLHIPWFIMSWPHHLFTRIMLFLCWGYLSCWCNKADKKKYHKMNYSRKFFTFLVLNSFLVIRTFQIWPGAHLESSTMSGGFNSCFALNLTECTAPSALYLEQLA